MKTLPGFADLASKLQFSPEMGRIWHDGERCVLLSHSALASWRSRLVSEMGHEAASKFFWGIGFAEGARCAIGAKQLRPNGDYLEAFAVGPQAHALTGFGWTQIESLENDPTCGHFEGRFKVHDSIEAAIHLSAIGRSTDPVCWMQTGFASGFATTFAGQPIIMRELECAGRGDVACVLHAKPSSEWDQLDDLEMAATPLVLTGQGTGAGEAVIGVSAGFLAAKTMIERTAASDATLLFMGETGVGKEVLAKLAHRLSGRSTKPFVALNCAAIPEGLIESEMFGVAKGAYTGAVAARPGRFEMANGGTLFLDEIATLSPLAQSKILRAIQEGEFERVGDTRTTRVDVRLIAASNVELNGAVRAGNFRADLFYRISTLPVRVPPLRQRREDIPVLLEHFRLRYVQRHNRTVSGFTARAINALLVYDFPGNVRELERMVERAVLLADNGRAIDLRHLFLETDNLELNPALGVTSDGRIGAVDNADDPEGLVRQVLDQIVTGGGTLLEMEGLVIRAALGACGGNVARAARTLGMTRRQLALRLEKMEPPGQAPQHH
ncbi:regulatory Fis family protein [Novosphingobium kunmingense]|uniref:Regulatory Fis family protein n=1 Tax=Novosphingobium kunmingense TaxID=1211806 RepID=A0A2N0H3P9_9SPHN|nr:sigma-54-dependent Fis family transcriptional regulator [Novosphingobium kunmingense]PKB13564.1 regulatory Fis family protein [Novosphingobium kunmingense]